MKILVIFFFAISGVLATRVKRGEEELPISAQQAPFFVSIRQNHEHICGGAFISKRHVITAANCIFEKTAKCAPNLSVISGVTQYYTRGTPHWIIAIIQPAILSTRQRNPNIIVLLLSKDFDENDGHISLPSNEPGYAEPATFVAFDKSPFGTPHLRQSEFIVLENRMMCHELPSYGMICGLHGVGNKVDPSYLGGPLTQQGKIIGICSWFDKNHFGYYEKIGKHLDFITQALECVDPTCQSPGIVVHPYENEKEVRGRA